MIPPRWAQQISKTRLNRDLGTVGADASRLTGRRYASVIKVNDVETTDRPYRNLTGNGASGYRP